jgi:hypothetical protein
MIVSVVQEESSQKVESTSSRSQPNLTEVETMCCLGQGI